MTRMYSLAFVASWAFALFHARASKVFNFTSKKRLSIGNWSGTLAEGTVTWKAINRSAEVLLIPELMSRKEALPFLKKVRSFEGLVMLPDSVDSYPVYEFYMMKDIDGKDQLPVLDKDLMKQRRNLAKITNPIISERVEPFVNRHYAEVCKGDCRVCTSLIRRYLKGERRTLREHADMDAVVTVVINLNDYGVDYEGGLYISAGSWQRYLALTTGDAVIHRSDLFHGVDMVKGDRWSWIMWFERDDCSKGDRWTVVKADADKGDPIAQYNAYRQVLTQSDLIERPPDSKFHYAAGLLQKSAKQGFIPAISQVGDMYRNGFGPIKANMKKAFVWYRRGAKANDPQSLLRLGIDHVEKGEPEEAWKYFTNPALATNHEAHLGIGHVLRTRGKLTEACAWFERSGTPSALWQLVEVQTQLGNKKVANDWLAKAARMGEWDACSEYRKTTKPKADVVIDCLALHGEKGFEFLLNEVYPTLQKQRDKVKAIRAMAQIARLSTDSARFFSRLPKDHRLEL